MTATACPSRSAAEVAHSRPDSTARGVSRPRSESTRRTIMFSSGVEQQQSCPIVTTSTPPWRGRRPNWRDAIWNKPTTRDQIIYTMSKREREGEQHAMSFTGLPCAYAEPPVPSWDVEEELRVPWAAPQLQTVQPRKLPLSGRFYCTGTETPATDKVPAFRQRVLESFLDLQGTGCGGCDIWTEQK
jgi:hypothetical protein